MPARVVRPFPPVLAGLATAGLVVAGLYVAKPVIVPLALSVLFSFVLTPVVTLLQHRARLPRVPAVVLTVLVTLSILAAGGYVLGNQVRGLVDELPKHRDEIRNKLKMLTGSEGGFLSQFSDLLKDETTATAGPRPGLPGTPPGPDGPRARSRRPSRCRSRSRRSPGWSGW